VWVPDEATASQWQEAHPKQKSKWCVVYVMSLTLCSDKGNRSTSESYWNRSRRCPFWMLSLLSVLSPQNAVLFIHIETKQNYNSHYLLSKLVAFIFCLDEYYGRPRVVVVCCLIFGRHPDSYRERTQFASMFIRFSQ
jgi:hypothetical protein